MKKVTSLVVLIFVNTIANVDDDHLGNVDADDGPVDNAE